MKNLETNYRRVPGISAATILGDGSVAGGLWGALPLVYSDGTFTDYDASVGGEELETLSDNELDETPAEFAAESGADNGAARLGINRIGYDAVPVGPLSAGQVLQPGGPVFGAVLRREDFERGEPMFAEECGAAERPRA